MTIFERFDKHKNKYLFLLVATYQLINNTINASSDWMETTRDGSPEFSIIEPFIWEYTSAISTLMLLPLVVIFWQRTPLLFIHLKTQLVKHILVASSFSVLHVCIMVWLREFSYWLMNSNYDFGPIFREFLYEYRKDVWGYVFFFGLYQVYRFVYSRLKGEANLIGAESAQTVETPAHLLVKKLDREFLVKVADIEWLEAAGNYVNLHSTGRIYPIRTTFADLTKRLKDKGFYRTHRSYAVNINAIDNISYQPSGDGKIQLKNGHTITLSRRYKDEFKQQFN
ncbi:MAG: LytTR family DNA-binding domain-containing protein [Paraglaciecola sp.]|uniref:LytR/AlgR family response regulator transcription factor n=1 Tax=Paraglaciecola sp. TaxID=1920173 RepID=UPI003297AB78